MLKITLAAVLRPSTPQKAAPSAVLAPPESEAPAAAAAYLALDSSKQSFRTCFDYMDDLLMQEEQAQASEECLADYPCAAKGKEWSPDPKSAWASLTSSAALSAALLSSKLPRGRRPTGARGFLPGPNSSRSSRPSTLPTKRSSASSSAAPPFTRLFDHVKAGLAKLSSSLTHRAPCISSAPNSLLSTNTGSDEAMPLMHACARSASSGYASGLVAPHSFVLTSLKLRRAVRERMQQQGLLQEERVALLAAGAHLDA